MRGWRVLAPLVLVALLGAGCGADGSPSGPAGASAPAGGPSRVVSLSPTATETLFAIGAGERVVAVDDQSDHPATAPRTRLSGHRPNAEAVVAWRPDLVVVAGNDNRIVDALRALDVPVLLQPPAGDLGEAYAQILALGEATGQAREAAGLVRDMRARIGRLVASVPRDGPGLTFFHELTPELYTASSATFIGQVYRLAGLRNVADRADRAGSGYPKLSAEYLIEADPDLIFLADAQCCRQSPATVAARPGWDAVAAVRGGGVIALDEDVASRWGPRVVDFLAAVVSAVRDRPAAPVGAR